jgi:Tfp pilus assembly PilM family ATPase
MIKSLSMSKFGRMRPPVRRVLAVDAGSRCLKLLLAQSDFGHLRIVKEELLDLPAEGLLTAEETQAALQEHLDAWGRPPSAVVLPQHVTISQVMDLPNLPESEVERVIRDETVKLGGVSESRIIYDFVRIGKPGGVAQRFWVTLCQEADIHERISRLGLEEEDLCEVTTTAAALVNAYSALNPQSERDILVHAGAQTTIVVILLAGQGAYASSFQMGGDFFTRSLARINNSTEEDAEALKRTKDLLRGDAALPEFVSVVEGWVAELKRQLNDWFDDNPKLATEAGSFQLIASGGGFQQAGLLEYLRSEAGLAIQAWPESTKSGCPSPSRGFEVAFGTVLQALGHSQQPVSLLPETYRAAWDKRLWRQRIEFASLVLVLISATLLGIGLWQKHALVTSKEGLLSKVRHGQQTLNANSTLETELITEYETLRPVLAAQQFTLDTLKTFALIQQARSNRSFWYVVFADQQSYFTIPVPVSTNKPARINLASVTTERGLVLSITNIPVAKHGFIAELTFPEPPDTARAVLSQLVTDLNKDKLFSRVDLLSEDLRRDLADPKVILMQAHYAIALELNDTNFQAAVPLATASTVTSPRRAGRSPADKERTTKPL